MAEVASVTYPSNATEYRVVLSGTELDHEFRRLVFANWIVLNSAYTSKFVSEITDLASHDSIILDSLIETEYEAVSEKALQIIVQSLGSVPSLSEPLLRKILFYRSSDVKLIDLAIRRAIIDYVHSGTDVATLQTVLEQNQFIEWLVSGQNWRLAGAARTAISAPESCSRAWEVLYKLPDPAFIKDILISTVDSLLPVTAQFWSLSTLGTWVEIIRRVETPPLITTRGSKLTYAGKRSDSRSRILIYPQAVSWLRDSCRYIGP